MRTSADAQRYAFPKKLHALLLGMLVFKTERRHVAFAAAVEDVDSVCAQPARGVGSIDRGISAAHHDHRALDAAQPSRLVGGDQLEGVHPALFVFARDAKPLHGSQSEA